MRGAADRIEEARLFDAYHDRHEPRDRERLFGLLMPLARSLAVRYTPGARVDDDLLQVAGIGLLKAIDGYEPGQGRFTAYAVPTILGEIKRYFRDTGWSMRVSRDTQERALRVVRASEAMELELGRSPTPEELAARVGLGPEQVLEAREAARCRTAISLDAPVGRERDEPAALLETVGADDAGFDLVDDLESIRPAMRLLDARERTALALRFGGDMTQAQIADELGISQMHVSRVLRRALDRLALVTEPRQRVH